MPQIVCYSYYYFGVGAIVKEEEDTQTRRREKILLNYTIEFKRFYLE